MALSQADYRVLSRPCEVLWAGFRSDTFTLQQMGWELAVQQEINYARISLLLRNRAMQLYALSDAAEFDFYRGVQDHIPSPRFIVRHISPQIQVVRHDVTSIDYRVVDAQPQIVQQQIKSIEDLGIFAVPLARTEEIIVDPADVSAMLEQIHKMQSEGQKEIRARNRQRERSYPIPQQVFHAQILSFAA
ncbi:MAG: hypothetical protein KGL39_59750 [Patescibacteria group bacterium]|nr:hypothetical protein [Patescibacteria group bacterium]